MAKMRAMAAGGLPEYPATVDAADSFSNDKGLVVQLISLHFAVCIICGCRNTTREPWWCF